MALTSEEMLVQSKVLVEATESNPNMPYKANAKLNKGLNPEAFAGANSKIVNAINLLYTMVTETRNTAFNLNDKVNGVILDVDEPLNAEKWNALKDKLKAIDPNAETVIQALELLFNGNAQANLLNLTEEDNGKVLSVFVGEDGKVTTKAIPMTGGGGESSAPPTAQEVAYTNPKHSSLNTVAKALDYILANLNSGGGTGPSGPITWDQIDGKPEIPDALEITAGNLALNANSVPMSTVPLASDSDIEAIIKSLDVTQ